MSSFHDQQRAAIKRYVDEMPTFSPATAKIVQLANKLNTPANDIVAAIRLDPVLTGRVLQLVNSAYFSLAQKVTSLNRALVYLGINTIKNLALSTAVMSAFDTKNKELAELIRPTWQHSLATAVCAKELAKAAKIPASEIEEYFIAGLLHDLGRIILIQTFFLPGTMAKKASINEETERFGIDHAEVGSETLKKWKFRDEIITAALTYHRPEKSNRIAHALFAADLLTYRLNLNGSDNPPSTNDLTIPPSTWDALGVSENAALQALASAKDQISKAEIFLNITSSTEKFVEKE